MSYFEWMEIEVTPEEEEAWQLFLTKFNQNLSQCDTIETQFLVDTVKQQ